MSEMRSEYKCLFGGSSTKCHFSLEDILKCGKQTFPPIGPWELVSYLKPLGSFILGLFDYAFEIKLVFMIKFLGMLGFADK